MKILSLLLLATSLLFTFNASQETPELQEATTLTASVVKLFNQGKYEEALPLAKRALQIREKALPRTDQRVADSLTNLGEVYIGKEDYRAARDTFKRLLQVLEERFGPEDVRLASTLDRLAPLQYRAASFDDAEEAFKRALALREKALGSDNEEVARAAFAIADFYRKRRNFQPAVDNYKRAMTTYGRLSGVKTDAFERVRDGFYCLSYEHNKPELGKEISRIYAELSGADPAREPEPGTILNGRAISLPKPEYPEGARQRRLQGMVVVSVMIDEAGGVIGAKDMCQGPPYLSESSVAAALKARFTTTKLSGMPVKVTGVIVYNFVAR
ncbi:MAG TPA: TonB family protein [Pyrinomonadaceae bacterium]|nr:TonB family protein [Pyrinomonadaceae bacterium]